MVATPRQRVRGFVRLFAAHPWHARCNHGPHRPQSGQSNLERANWLRALLGTQRSRIKFMGQRRQVFAQSSTSCICQIPRRYVGVAWIVGAWPLPHYAADQQVVLGQRPELAHAENLQTATAVGTCFCYDGTCLPRHHIVCGNHGHAKRPWQLCGIHTR